MFSRLDWELRWKQVKVLRGPATVMEEFAYKMPLENAIWEGKVDIDT